jgi:hypothetical protein
VQVRDVVEDASGLDLAAGRRQGRLQRRQPARDLWLPELDSTDLRTPRSMSSGQGGSDTLLDPESGSVSRLAERSTPSIVEAAHRRRRVVYRRTMP